MSLPTNRLKRRHSIARPDQRSEFARDRDRILYSSAFRRLDGVTQIVRAAEADIFHNRLTHSMKVAQVGRRLAEHCLAAHRSDAVFHGLDPEVVEAACLGHDLGHPPFGHIGEETLNRVLTERQECGEPLDAEGFEGNAQSFRIVTKLAVRFPECDGLDLTGGVLAALQKYPWRRDVSHKDRKKKWGFYVSEQDDFDFCTEGAPEGKRTFEAELMDWADDIAYSVHDLEDFHRCNMIPWGRIIGPDAPDQERIIKSATDRWHDAPPDAGGRLRAAHRRLSDIFSGFESTILTGSYSGRRDQREALRSLTSTLIGRYIIATRPQPEADYDGNVGLLLEDDHVDEVTLLKQIARDYILNLPALAAQQKGQQRVLEYLFDDFLCEIQANCPRVLPVKFHHLIEDEALSPGRIAADCVASLTEGEAISLYRRLTGGDAGSVLDPIVR